MWLLFQVSQCRQRKGDEKSTEPDGSGTVPEATTKKKQVGHP
jgi:hypothetical protein